MLFNSPALLWALAALAIPILLHLFYFRRFKKVEFSNVRFLKEIREETQSRSRLRNLLVLALRLLAFAAIILAFAQPFMGGNKTKAGGEQRVGIFVDNSYSMSAQASDVALLEKAKQRAREIVRSSGESAQYQIVSNELSGASSRLVGQEDALGLIDQILLTAQSRPADALLSRFSTLSQNQEAAYQAQAYIISDFQASQFAEGLAQADTALNVALVPINAVAQRNVSIDSVWLANPVQLVGEPVQLLVRLTNHGDENAEAVRVSARTNNTTQPFGTKNVPARTTVTDTLGLSAQRAGWTDVRVEITDFPIEFDDTYNLTIQIRDKLNVLAISDGPVRTNLRAAFPPNSPLVLTHERAGNVSYSQLSNYQLIILDGLATVSSGLIDGIDRFVTDGGKVAVFPAAQGALSDYNRLLSKLTLGSYSSFQAGEYAVGKLNTNSFVFSDVFERLPGNLRLPKVQGRFGGVSRFGESLMTFRDGKPFLVAQNKGLGVAYVATAGLDDASSDLVRNGEVFVPMLYRMALSGTTSKPAAYTLGRDQLATYNVPANSGEAALTLNGEGGTYIPGQRRLGSQVILTFGEAPTQAGFYQLQGAQDSVLAHLAFNYDRRESPQDYLSPANLADLGYNVFDGNVSGSLEASLSAASLGKQWWPMLIILALIALLLEALVIRFWQPGRVAQPKAKPAMA